MSPFVFGERYYLACHCPESLLMARGVFFNTHTMERETFVFYKDWLNVIRDLPSEVQLEVYQAITEYAIYGNLIELKPLAKVAFGFVKQTIDRDTQKYVSIKEKRKEAGAKGGRPLKTNELEESKEKQKNQLVFEKSKKSNCPLNVNVNDLFQQTNKQAGAHEENPEAEKQPLNAYEDFKGNLPALEAWFAKRWNDAKKHYKAGVIGKVAILGQSKLNLIDVAKTYTQREIDLAIKGVFIQKEIYPQFTLSPDKMLETYHFSKFYNAGLTSTQLYNESPQKGQKSSKKGVVRNVGDL